MDKNLLIRLLTSSQKVILPGFGAFLHKNKDTQPIFTPFLTKDDGFLTSQVAAEYGVSSEDALEMVNAFTSHIREVLKNNDKYVFEGVGSLEVDINGTLTFVMDLSKQIPHQAVSTPPVVEREVKPVETESQPQPQPHKPLQFGQSQTSVPPRSVSPQPIAGTNRVQFSTPTQPTPTPAPQPTARPQQGVTPTIPRPQRPVVAPPQRPVTPPVRPVVRPVGERPVAPRPNEVPQQRTPNPQPANPNSRPVNQRVEGEGQTAPKQRPLSKAPGAPRKKRRGDTLLMIAIIAAVIVIGIMIFGIITAQEVSYIE